MSTQSARKLPAPSVGLSSSSSSDAHAQAVKLRKDNESLSKQIGLLETKIAQLTKEQEKIKGLPSTKAHDPATALSMAQLEIKRLRISNKQLVESLQRHGVSHSSLALPASSLSSKSNSRSNSVDFSSVPALTLPSPSLNPSLSPASSMGEDDEHFDLDSHSENGDEGPSHSRQSSFSSKQQAFREKAKRLSTMERIKEYKQKEKEKNKKMLEEEISKQKQIEKETQLRREKLGIHAGSAIKKPSSIPPPSPSMSSTSPNKNKAPVAATPVRKSSIRPPSSVSTRLSSSTPHPKSTYPERKEEHSDQHENHFRRDSEISISSQSSDDSPHFSLEIDTEDQESEILTSPSSKQARAKAKLASSRYHSMPVSVSAFLTSGTHRVHPQLAMPSASAAGPLQLRRLGLVGLDSHVISGSSNHSSSSSSPASSSPSSPHRRRSSSGGSGTGTPRHVVAPSKHARTSSTSSASSSATPSSAQLQQAQTTISLLQSQLEERIRLFNDQQQQMQQLKEEFEQQKHEMQQQQKQLQQQLHEQQVQLQIEKTTHPAQHVRDTKDSNVNNKEEQDKLEQELLLLNRQLTASQQELVSEREQRQRDAEAIIALQHCAHELQEQVLDLANKASVTPPTLPSSASMFSSFSGDEGASSAASKKGGNLMSGIFAGLTTSAKASAAQKQKELQQKHKEELENLQYQLLYVGGLQEKEQQQLRAVIHQQQLRLAELEAVKQQFEAFKQQQVQQWLSQGNLCL